MSCPTSVPDHSDSHAVMRAVNAARGRGLTLQEIAAQIHVGPHHIAPLVWQMYAQWGWLRVLPGSRWYARRYSNARLHWPGEKNGATQ